MPLEYSLIQVAGITELGAYVEAASLVISSSPTDLPPRDSMGLGLDVN